MIFLFCNLISLFITNKIIQLSQIIIDLKVLCDQTTFTLPSPCYIFSCMTILTSNFLLSMLFLVRNTERYFPKKTNTGKNRINIYRNYNTTVILFDTNIAYAHTQVIIFFTNYYLRYRLQCIRKHTYTPCVILRNENLSGNKIIHIRK